MIARICGSAFSECVLILHQVENATTVLRFCFLYLPDGGGFIAAACPCLGPLCIPAAFNEQVIEYVQADEDGVDEDGGRLGSG